MATYDIRTQIPDKIVTGDILNCPYSGTVQSLTLPKGQYRLECWGAAARKPSSNPGKGGYSRGTINLTAATTVYFYVGGQPTTSTSISGTYWCKGGWNGGGASRQSSSSGGDSGGGGGATDICLVESSVTEDSYHRYIRSAASYNSRLIVAGGAGGGYSSSYASPRAGGYCPSLSISQVNYIGGMTAPGSIASTSNEVIGAFGYGATSIYTGDDHSGGGGGWYGGGSQGDSYGGGGSSFVWSTLYANYAPSSYTVPASMQMSDIACIHGNASMTSPSGSTETGHAGDGYARITVIKVESGLECYVKQNSAWNSGEVYNKQNGSWTKELGDVPSEYLDICIPSFSDNIIFDNTAKTPTWSHYLSKYVTISGTTSATKAGTYTTIFTLKEDTYRWFDEITEPKNIEWTIAKRVLSIPTQSNILTYNKAAQSPTWNNYNSTYLTLGGTTSGTNAGSYSATFTIKDTDSCVWSDGTTGAKTVNWNIGVRKLTKPTKSSTTYTYIGISQTLSFSNFNSSYETKSGDYSAINAGNYTCYIALNDTVNTQWSDGTTSQLTFSWSIAKRTLTVPTQSGMLSYTGSSQSPSWSNYNSTYMTIGGDTSGTNAGSYIATFTFKSPDNCVWNSGGSEVKTVNWSIAKLSLAIPSCSSVIYTGEIVSPIWENYDDTKMSISGDTSGIEIGSYTAVFSLLDKVNYQWSDGTIADQSVVWEIIEYVPQWEVIQPTALSETRYSLAATAVGSYALFGSGYYASKLDAYDPSLTRTTPTSLSTLCNLAATTVGNYALFGGGYNYRSFSVPYESTGVDAFDTSLTRASTTGLSQRRSHLSATTVGNYALFGGGTYTSDNGYTRYSDIVDAYDTSLTRTTPTALSQARCRLAATTVGSYALFGGGEYDGTTEGTVDAYDTSLTRTISTGLSARYNLAATTIGNYALFGGGNYASTVAAYDPSLTRTTPTSLSMARELLAATTIGNYALFGGGNKSNNYYSTVDAYDTSLTRTIPTELSQVRSQLAATTIGDYALFGGGCENSSTRYSTVDAISYT